MREAGILGLILACGSAWAAVPAGANRPGAAGGMEPTAQLEIARKYPGVRVAMRGDRPSMVYGRDMARAGHALGAAQAFVEQDIAAFAVGRPDLAVQRIDELMTTPKTIVVFEQMMEGLPVERGTLRVIVHNDEQGSAVVLASSRLAAAPEGGFAPDSISAEESIQRLAATPEGAIMQEFSEPVLVVYAGEGDEEAPRPAARAWKILGAAMGMNAVPMKYTFFVDASTGEVLHARNDISHGSADVTGTLRGLGSPGLLPDSASNPPVLLNLPELGVSISGGANTFSDRAGVFTIQNGLLGPLSIVASITGGRWVPINDTVGPELTSTLNNVTPPGPADLVLNQSPTEFTTAQINAFVHQNLARAYFRDRAPTFTALDTPTPANVNLGSTCNAFYDSQLNDTNFFNASAPGTSNGCVNTAYSTVVAHEYGHHIVNRLGLAQGAFGEGFSDTIALMLYDDPVVGRNFRFNGGVVRNPDAANQQYPCTSSAIHTCGQILGGVWWTIRTNFGAFYGEPAGLDLARQLHVDWAQITAGGISLNSAHPQTAVEVLTVDDNDSNIGNGTPNYTRICDAFAQHGITCPALSLIDFQYPDGQPAFVAPAGGTPLVVQVAPINGTPVSNTGRLLYRLNGGSFVTLPMNEVSANRYEVVFPAGVCPSEIEYYVEVDVVGGSVATDPPNAPGGAVYNALVASSVSNILSDNAETLAPGWVVGAAGDTASSGLWTWGNPIGTAAQPEDDRTADPGVNCFFTGQGVIGGGLGDNDVDNGFTTLISPVFDLSGASNAQISYWRWYSNNTGGRPGEDVLVVSITNDNGATWTTVETVGPSGVEAIGGWIKHAFDVGAFVTPTANVRLRFVANDEPGLGSLVEAGIDDLSIDTIVCAPPPACPGDANGDNAVNFSDVTAVLENFNTAGPAGDANRDNAVNFGDITSVLENFGRTCS